MIRPMQPWRRIVRVCPCKACGVPLVQYLGEEPASVVERHNLLPDHRAWRYNHGDGISITPPHETARLPLIPVEAGSSQPQNQGGQ